LFFFIKNGGGDIYISGLVDRNRSLHNDIVAIKLKEKFNWKILDAYRNEVNTFFI